MRDEARYPNADALLTPADVDQDVADIDEALREAITTPGEPEVKDTRCALCGGALVDKEVVMARDVSERGVVLIRDVPARVCDACGHRWLSQATMRGLEEVADGRRSPDAVQQVPVYAWSTG